MDTKCESHTCQSVKVVTLKITAVTDGSRAFLCDSRGRRLNSQAFALERLRPADPETVRTLPWRHVADLIVTRENLKACYVQKRTSWDKKINNIIGSFRLRSRDLHLPRSRRRHFERFATTRWSSAAARMVVQARNCHLYNSRSGWVRWSYTVTKNQNRRVHARYEKDSDN